ncbi:uncharacterized protein LOC108596736 [Drosophila busckii]|uniref:uncharacterized protein LOC108596736 n=1 Tax=Drosophila busckii TaxID=30019 RepID=UPI00083F3A14|nr:uncharacterized protein LOC108596736 [Drosophila busckii]
MCLRSCCFYFSLSTGCMFIGFIWIWFLFMEIISLGEYSIFIHLKMKSWAKYLQAFITSMGIISSLLLIEGAYKRQRCSVLFWIVVFFVIEFLYVVLAIIDINIRRIHVFTTVAEFLIIIGLIYCLFIATSLYVQLTKEATEAVQV